MNRISNMLLAALAIFLFIAVIPIAGLATNEDVSINEKISIVKTINILEEEEKVEYIIYIKEMSKKIFKYAFTNMEPEKVQEMDLYYINSVSDFGENQTAYLDAETYEKLSKENKQIYIWAKDENENLILEGIQLDLSKALTEENIEKVEKLTKRIEVKIADSEQDTDETNPIRQENIDGVEETAKVGYIQILDNDKKAKYYYEMIKLPGTESYNKLKTLTEKIQNEYDGMDIYEKLQFVVEFEKALSTVTSEANWQEVNKNKRIIQPEESVKDDEYIVLLKKVSKQDGKTVIIEDVQFLIAHDKYIPNMEKEKIVTQETTKLPITYDSIALYVILGIVVILTVVVFIRIRKLNKQNEEK